MRNFRERHVALLLLLSCSFICREIHGIALPHENWSKNRIVGGATIGIESIPYMLSFMIDGHHACGAAVLRKHWALTAAHCVLATGNDPTKFQVRSGSSVLDTGGTVHNVSQAIPHERFDYDTNDYDIAILKVDPPFQYSNVTQPLKLPRNHSFDEDYALIAGWGYFLDFEPVVSQNLQYVVLPRVSRAECIEDYKKRYTVTPRQVCYGLREGGEDACKGDSGGPLVVRQNIVLGITSWGDGCAERYTPGVYTEILQLRHWIENSIKRHSTS